MSISGRNFGRDRLARLSDHLIKNACCPQMFSLLFHRTVKEADKEFDHFHAVMAKPTKYNMFF